jgi:hypothetical protein
MGACHHESARPQIADAEIPRILTAAMDILNKQWQTSDIVWSPRVGIGRGTNKSTP